MKEGPVIWTLKKLMPGKYKRAVKERLGLPSLHWSLVNLKRKKFCPATVLDIGAYKGEWARAVLEVFPSANILMVEAQKSKTPFLQKIKREYPNTDYAISLLSSADGEEKYFYENETASHIRTTFLKDIPGYTLTTRTLDSLLQELQFPLPDLLKMDVQGHEIEVLKGASISLSHAGVCLLEVTLLDHGYQSPLLLELLNFMDEKGFQAYDICGLIRRPFDKALFQMDIFFVKKDSYLIADKRWA